MSLFNEMSSTFGIQPNERTYRNIIMTCNRAEHKARDEEKNGHDTREIHSVIEWWEVGLALFRRMKEERIEPDVKTYSSMISACEAAGEWQRALGILENLIEESIDRDDDSLLNMHCFNSAISACEKGDAWVEALEIYERMVDIGGSISPNFVTISSLVLALDKAGQKDLAQSKFEEGVKKRIIKPWKWTQDEAEKPIYALVSRNDVLGIIGIMVLIWNFGRIFTISRRRWQRRLFGAVWMLTGSDERIGS